VRSTMAVSEDPIGEVVNVPKLGTVRTPKIFSAKVSGTLEGSGWETGDKA
jgi:hypothetical protein